jgi:hypothetical protein
MAVSLADKESKGHVLAVMAMENILHFKRYEKWYVDFEYFHTRSEDILFIGFQESLETDFNQLKSILKIPLAMALPTDDLNAHRNQKSADKRLDESAIAALKEWYSDDFRFIALCKEIMSNKVNALELSAKNL